MQKDIYGDNTYSPFQRWMEEIPYAEHWHELKRLLPSIVSEEAAEPYMNGQSDGHVIHGTQNDDNGKHINDARKK